MAVKQKMKAKAGGKVKGGAGAGGGMQIASLNPDNFEGGGLATEFWGTLRELRGVPWTYPDGSLTNAEGQVKYALAVRAIIEPDPGEEVAGLKDDGCVHEYYSNGDLRFFVPSNDGVEPAGGDLEDYAALAAGHAEVEDEDEMAGIYFLRVGKRKEMSPNTKAAFLLQCMREAGVDTASAVGLDDFDGIHGYWTRIQMPQPEGRGGALLDASGKPKKAGEALVLTEVGEGPAAGAKAASKGSAKGKAAGKVKKAAPVEEEEEEDEEDVEVEGEEEELSAAVDAVILAALQASKNGWLATKQLPFLMLKNIDKDSQAEAVELIGDEDWLGGDDRSFVFDPEAGRVELAEE